jgi:competence protein ComEC
VPRLLVLLALSLALGIFAADCAEPPPALAALAGSLAAALGFACRGARSRAACACGVALCAGALSLATRLEEARRHRPEGRVEMTVEARVAAVRRRPGGLVEFQLDRVIPVDTAAAPARLRVVVEPTPPGIARFEDSQPGDRVRARLRLRPPAERRNPGSRSTLRSVSRAGIGADARLADPGLHVRVSEGPPALRALHVLRGRIARELEAAGPGGPLLAALSVGERAELARGVRRDFARLGLTHLLSVSGLHVVIAAGIAFAACVAVGRRVPALAARRDPRRAAMVASLAAAGVYTLLSGAEVPAQRSWWMLAAFALCALRAGPRRAAPPLALAALIVLALDPAALFDVGAQLSFAACAALAAARRAPERERGAGGRLSRLRDALDAALRTSATALAATAPLAATRLGVAAPLALAANLVAVPWTGALLLPASLAAAFASACGAGSLGRLVIAGAERVADGSQRALGWAASLAPGAEAGAAPGAGALAACALLCALALGCRRTLFRVALAATANALLVLVPPAAISPPVPRAVFLDVGQGDATLLQSRHAAVLIDGGPAFPERFDLGASTVVPALRALGVRRLDVLVATHADSDHSGGLPAVLEAFEVGVVWVPRGALADPGFWPLRAAAAARGVSVEPRGAGDDAARFGDLGLEPLWPPAEQSSLSRNDASLVVRAELAGRRVLLPGDIGREAEALLVASGADLEAELLKLPHHGSRSSASAGFLDAVRPLAAIASAPCFGRFRMPHPDVLARARERAVPVWWTGRDGAVLVPLTGTLFLRGMGEPRCRTPGGSGAAAPGHGASTGP